TFCSKESGSVFPPGTTTVYCASFDDCDNISFCSFTVTVVDTTPPVITCPADQTVSCNRANGAVVHYTTTAMDNCDATPLLSCTPPSCSLFPPGVTTVNCTATDSSSHSSHC